MRQVIGYSRKILCAFAMLAVLLILIAPNQAKSINIDDHQVKPLAVTYQGRLTFADGTPVETDGETLQAHLLEYPPGFWKDIEVPLENGRMFKMKNAPASAATRLMAFPEAGGKRYADIGPFKDGLFFLTVPYPGKYVLRVNDIDIKEFTATPVGRDGLNIDLPQEVTLPFNYMILTTPNQEIQEIDVARGGRKTITADDNGRILLLEPYGKGYAIIKDGILPTISTFNKPKKKTGSLSQRTSHLKPHKPGARIGAHLHNIKTDTYYWAGPSWLMSYSGKSKKSSLRPTFLGDDTKRRNGSVSSYLDEKGNPRLAVWSKGQSRYQDPPEIFSIGPNLGLTPFDDPYYPAYRFKGKTIKNLSWQIPTLMGIPFNEGGGNNISIECSVDYSGDKAASRAHREAVGRVLRQFYPQCYQKDPAPGCGEHYGNCLGWNPDCKKALPASPPVVKGSTTASNSSNFSVVFDAESKIYKFDPEEIFPDPLNALNDVYNSVDVKKCTITVNGYGPFPYSYQDIPPNIGLSCSDLITVKEGEPQTVKNPDGTTRTIRVPQTERVFDEECLKNLKESLKSYPVIMGFEGEADPMGMSVRLMDPQREELGRMSGPINMQEGPYSSLRYKGKKVTKFTSSEAAKETCKSPRSRREGAKTVYSCEEEFTFDVCPDKYSFDFTENGIRVDYDSMYGGDCSASAPSDEGAVDIQIRVEADGYQVEETVVSTPNYSPSRIVLFGKVQDHNGQLIAGATVRLIDLDTEVDADSAGVYRIEVATEGSRPFESEQNFFLRPVSRPFQVVLSSDDPLVANGRTQPVTVEVSAEGKPLAGQRFQVQYARDYEHKEGRIIQYVGNTQTLRTEITTDAQGRAHFNLPAPVTDKEKIRMPLSKAGNQLLFPVIGYLQFRDLNSDKAEVIRYELQSPFPVIKRFRMPWGNLAGTWQKVVSRVEIEDFDSDQFDISIFNRGGEFGYAGGHGYKNKLIVEKQPSPFEFRYKPDFIGIDLNDIQQYSTSGIGLMFAKEVGKQLRKDIAIFGGKWALGKFAGFRKFSKAAKSQSKGTYIPGQEVVIPRLTEKGYFVTKMTPTPSLLSKIETLDNSALPQLVNFTDIGLSAYQKGAEWHAAHQEYRHTLLADKPHLKGFIDGPAPQLSERDSMDIKVDYVYTVYGLVDVGANVFDLLSKADFDPYSHIMKNYLFPLAKKAYDINAAVERLANSTEELLMMNALVVVKDQDGYATIGRTDYGFKYKKEGQ